MSQERSGKSQGVSNEVVCNNSEIFDFILVKVTFFVIWPFTTLCMKRLTSRLDRGFSLITAIICLKNF